MIFFSPRRRQLEVPKVQDWSVSVRSLLETPHQGAVSHNTDRILLLYQLSPLMLLTELIANNWKLHLEK